MPRPGSRGPQTSAHTIMDEADFSEDTTCKQQEDLPYDGVFSQMKMCSSYNFTSTNNNLAVWEDVVLSGKDPQEKSACCKMCQNTAVVTANVVNNRHDKDKQCTLASCVPANKGDAPKSHISDVLLHRLSREQFLRAQGLGYENLPETLHADRLDDTAILTSVISRYGKSYCPKEQSPEFTDQPSSKSGTENSSSSSFSPGTTGDTSSPLETPVAAGQSHQEAPSFMSRTKGPGDEHRNCQGQTPQRWLTEKASSGHRFKYSPGQVRYQLPDFSRVAPQVKIPRNTITNKPLTIANQASFSPGLRNKSTVVQDSLGTMSGPNCVGKHQPEQKRKLTEPSQETQMEPATHTCQEALTGVKSVKCHLKLTPTTQRDPSLNSYIFQKISQGRQMCQKLKEQTDQLKTKIQEFSKRIKQDPLCHLQDIRLMTKEHAGCVPGPRSSRRREVTGLPEAGPQEVTSKELSELAPKMKQKMEKGGHRRTNYGKFSSTIHEKTLCHDSPLGSDPGPSFRPESGTGLQRNRGEDSGSEGRNSQRVCSEEPPKEFHYRYDTPGQDDLNHRGGHTSAQPHFLHENKMSSSSCSTSKWICSQRVNSEPFQDEHDSSTRKHPKTCLTCNTDPARPPTHLRFLRIPGIQSLGDRNNMEETESKILNSALDHALKTATVLKKTTDQMIKSIAEDLAKVHRWRYQLKHY
ncbi:protein AKNAD1 isoform X1 [Peromyscus leucopus]|uniref:protein AKNAD1 isoform X1 n=1 Tax=Peromyscus leucopus TaxID=10041 RepID=UPI00188519F1|nr:protein AKNAD1 isoform X1 [Peromyscus leucopus]XP_037062901.1 protein AKNAD1 isoform X1 [Peromyscus leucopus]XP_037062902.1 protein AKNAD1 isoform X1 [Peromyscus leucopus]XP_037062903.1 protein AKNAD1 isoform X1 [Peromyscus leucopus]